MQFDFSYRTSVLPVSVLTPTASQTNQEMTAPNVSHCTLFLALPGSMLILGELHDVPRNFSQLQIRVPVIAEVFKQPASAGGHDIGHPIAQAR